ncbi:MAG: restriction endonuclease subunit S [Alphaproteobacteria bacterium]|nr:restriction endonuclease subunit S [Alphaproteobacteria bacterium]
MSPDALPVAQIHQVLENGAAQRDLPNGWVWSCLGQVAAINPPTDFDRLADEAEIPFVPMAAVAEETGTIDVSRRRPVAAVRKGYVRFREGDVIFAKITPCMENGKTAPVLGIEGGYAAGSTEFHVLRPSCIDTRYLWYWLVRRAFRAEAQHNMSGTAGQLRVPIDYLRSTPVPLPPLPEQRRVVARIDELFAEIEEGATALDRARHGLDTWRRALLKMAVTGELTRDWREANRPAETGADLLARIRAERGATVEGVRRRHQLLRLVPIGTASLTTLPEGWVWASLGDLFDVTTGSTPSRAEPSFWEGTIPWVSSGEVAFCRIKKTRECITSTALKGSLNRLHPPGTVLLAMIGEGKTRGQCAILDIATCNNQNWAAIRVGLTPIQPRYIYYVLLERYYRSRRESQGGNQPALNARKVAAMVISLPSLDEIREIVRRLDDLLALGEAAEHEYVEAGTAQSKLRQSILRAGFEGRLVPQDPADEPASVLLARLRDSDHRTPTRRRRAGLNEDFSHPPLPGLLQQSRGPTGPARG